MEFPVYPEIKPLKTDPMKSRTLEFLKIAGVVGAMLLTGCAPGPGLRARTEFANFGQQLGPEMVNNNFSAMVYEDEAYAGTYSLRNRGTLYLQGVSEGSPEFQYRSAMVFMAQLKGALYIKDGAYPYFTAAYVPDHVGLLKRGDIVELRATGTYDVMLNFSKSHEGNAILRLLCRKADPAYKDCADKLPKIGNFTAVGPTGTPFLKSLTEYGYAFTPAYGLKGERLRELQ
jgi:hypothetical protein